MPQKERSKQPKALKLPCPLYLIFSFHFVSSLSRPLLLCATNRALLFLRSRSGTVFQDPSTRDARENNLESTLVVTATAATAATAAVATTTTMTLLNHHPLTHADRRCLSTRFSTFFLLPRPLYELSGPKLWPARETVNCRQRRRESTGGGLPVTFAGPFCRESPADFRLLASVASPERYRRFSSVLGEDYLGFERLPNALRLMDNSRRPFSLVRNNRGFDVCSRVSCNI